MNDEKKSRGFLDELNRFADWRDQNRPSISSITLAVRSKTVRRKLKLKKDAPPGLSRITDQVRRLEALANKESRTGARMSISEVTARNMTDEELAAELEMHQHAAVRELAKRVLEGSIADMEDGE